MGITCCSLVPDSIFGIDEFINISSILINAGIAIWIVHTIQNKLNNKRVLKDFYIDEVKELRYEYKKYLTDLINGDISPKNVISWHKLMNIKVEDLMMDLKNIYRFDNSLLKPYQIELRELITENPDFIDQFNSEKLTLTSNSINIIIKFQQNNNRLFSDLIVKINNN